MPVHADDDADKIRFHKCVRKVGEPESLVLYSKDEGSNKLVRSGAWLLCDAARFSMAVCSDERCQRSISTQYQSRMAVQCQHLVVSVSRCQQSYTGGLMPISSLVAMPTRQDTARHGGRDAEWADRPTTVDHTR